EQMLVKDGIKLFKFYFSVSKEEQARRFESRKHDLLKQYKLSPVDNLAQQLWDKYSVKKFQMLNESNRTLTPWTIIRSDNKKSARINCMKHILSNIDYEEKMDMGKLTPDSEIVISGIEEIKHMERNLFQPKQLRG
ncbi:MAG: polyphosphate kinase 2, partial [Candidatus Electrothrix sp. ATG2]|nr:polyphosphate kinase 2 [Candidatus Electrothrix sp. ATG2]